MWRIAEKPWIILKTYIHNTDIGGLGATRVKSTHQNRFLDIQKIFVNRTGQKCSAVDFTDDVQLGHEDASGTVPIKILDDGGSMIFVEGRRLFAIALSFR